MYIDFPLVGSEDFDFPCYINSHLFWPNEERSLINYEDFTVPHAEMNLKILKHIVPLFDSLLSYASANQWKGIEHICLFNYSYDPTLNYYEEIVLPTIRIIMTKACIQTISGKWVSPIEVLFPNAPSN